RPMESEEPPTIFPFAGWNREDLVPDEARAAIGGEQWGSGVCSNSPVSYCCGDYNCAACEITSHIGACSPTCAAGDHCNAYHAGSGCGDIWCSGSLGSLLECGTAADQLCPHTCGTRTALTQYQNNPCGFSRLQWETGYCYYHTPENHWYNYLCGKWDCGVLFPGDQLYAGQNLWSCDGSHRLAMQTDGNAVLYRADGTAIWSSGTNGKGGHYITQQTDG